MTEFEPGEVNAVADGSDELLAARLLAAARMLASLNADPDVRIRLHLRFTAICTALKLPGASKTRGLRRLERLIADAKRAQETS